MIIHTSQIILSGNKEALIDLSNTLKAEKKKCIFLPVSAPVSLFFNEASRRK